MLRIIPPDDPDLQRSLGNAHQRFQALCDEAEAAASAFYERTLGRAMSIEEAIAHVFSAVERDGDAAVCEFSQRFDGNHLTPETLCRGSEAMAAAWEACTPQLREALRRAVDQVTAYQRRLLPVDFGTHLDEPLGARFRPVERVGGYVPGGTAGSTPLCSSVIMNLVPAAVAGVPHLALATPPRPDGSVAPEILAAASISGIETVYTAGGIPAIAAMACGTETLPKVDTIVGPGNIFVTLAKRHAYGRVDIDMLAGPSEILVISDGSVDPEWIAADLLSQAEHDVLAMSIVLCTDVNHAQAISEAVERQCALLPEERRTTASESIKRHGLAVVCDDLTSAAALSNRWAPEHLEVLVREPAALLPLLHHAGAIFVGPWSPEPIGDYIAGPSHTLPTGGTARMWSGIGADIFLRRTSIINFDEADFRQLSEAAVTLARAEGLEAHARSIEIRHR